MKLAPERKNYRELPKITSVGIKKTSNKSSAKIWLFIAGALAGLYFVPLLTIGAVIFVFTNKKANQRLKEFIKESKIDISGNAFVKNAAEKIAEGMTPEQLKEIKEKMAEYHIHIDNEHGPRTDKEGKLS